MDASWAIIVQKNLIKKQRVLVSTLSFSHRKFLNKNLLRNKMKFYIMFEILTSIFQMNFQISIK